MLREVGGKIETYYIDNIEEKQLIDMQRKKYRTLDMPIDEQNKKHALRQRRKTASDLRKIKQMINQMS